jgi:1-deoxy-D-xylulose-5-phosphate reductoisomerase
VPRIDWTQARQWEFHEPDFGKFRLLGLAYESLRRGGAASCILNAADEVAVAAFLRGAIRFPAIAQVVEETLNRMPFREPASVAEILETDGQARRKAQEVIAANAAAFGPLTSARPAAQGNAQ